MQTFQTQWVSGNKDVIFKQKNTIYCKNTESQIKDASTVIVHQLPSSGNKRLNTSAYPPAKYRKVVRERAVNRTGWI